MSEKERKALEELKAIKADWAKLITQMEEKVASELKPFLDGIRTMDTSSSNFRLFKQAYAYFVEKFEIKRQIITRMFMDWRETRRRLEKSSVGLSDVVHSLFLYLGLVESLGNTLTDILVMLLVANEKEFHIECLHTVPRIKHVVSIKDLEKERVSLTAKLNFLRDNGITEFTSVIDSKLRNAIAHLKFDIRKDEVYIKGQGAEPLIVLQLDSLIAVIVKVTILLKYLDKEKGLTPKKRKRKQS